MKKLFSFEYKNNTLATIVKNKEYSLFDTVHSLEFSGTKPVANGSATVYVSKSQFSYTDEDKMLLVNPKNDAFLTVNVILDDNVKDGEIKATLHLKELLGIEKGNVYLCTFKSVTATKCRPQRIANIRDNTVSLSAEDYDSLMSLTDGDCKLFEVYNSFTLDCMIVKSSHVLRDTSIKKGEIRITRRHRLWLGFELPEFLSDAQWSYLQTNVANADDLDFINSIYLTNDHVLTKVCASDKARAKTIIDNAFCYSVKVIPVVETLPKDKPKSLWSRICDFYVGKSTISLMVRRPYDIDEGEDIVRMSRSNMNLLGIDEMDMVVLQYKNKKVKCRVLEFDDKDAFLETNPPISMDLAVGIPVHVRKALGVNDLQSVIKIDRDTRFIFKKSLNEQVVPVLLTLFSANIFSALAWWISVPISLVAIPVVLYFNLSSKRNMRAH